MKRLIAGLPFFFTAALLLAQDDPVATPVELTEKQAAGLAALGCGVILVPMIISIALWLTIAIWIMKDSARRQSPNRTLVVVLGWLVPLVGLIVHLVTRPKTIPGAPNP